MEGWHDKAAEQLCCLVALVQCPCSSDSNTPDHSCSCSCSLVWARGAWMDGGLPFCMLHLHCQKGARAGVAWRPAGGLWGLQYWVTSICQRPCPVVKSVGVCGCASRWCCPCSFGEVAGFMG